MDRTHQPRIRWRPAAWIIIVGVLAQVAIRLWPISQIQVRNLILFSLGGITLLALTAWWLFASRATWRARLGVLAIVAVLIGSLAATFRFHGVTGDLVPIFKPRWANQAATSPPAISTADLQQSTRPDFPQYLGPARNAVINDGTTIATDWNRQPPKVLWRRPIGPAWSGFAIVGNRAVTLEQRGPREVVVCLNALTGNLLWEFSYPARYASSLGGEGPRTTPTVAAGRVFTFGATGVLNCLDLENGELIWQRKLGDLSPDHQPEWGYAGSPLVHEGNVIVSAGHPAGKSLQAFRVETGEPVWQGGSQPAGYASPIACTLAGVPQIISFNLKFITAHNPTNGTILWEHPWGNRQPVVAQPLPVGPDQIIFSSGYGVGAERLRIERDPAGTLTARRLWKSISLKAKMASFIEHQGHLYGLDDGILTCVDAQSGKRQWKSGRYGHGQLLWVDGRLLITAESGDLCLLEPNPTAPNEVARFPVFNAKTWNPPALSGEILLMRTDQEAACIRLPLE